MIRPAVQPRPRSALALGLSAVLLAASLAACSSLPNSGPSNSEVVENISGKDNPLGARLVDLTPAIGDRSCATGRSGR